MRSDPRACVQRKKHAHTHPTLPHAVPSAPARGPSSCSRSGPRSSRTTTGAQQHRSNAGLPHRTEAGSKTVPVPPCMIGGMQGPFPPSQRDSRNTTYIANCAGDHHAPDATESRHTGDPHRPTKIPATHPAGLRPRPASPDGMLIPEKKTRLGPILVMIPALK